MPIKPYELVEIFLKINSVGNAPPSVKNWEYNLKLESIFVDIINSYWVLEIEFTLVVKETGYWEKPILIKIKKEKKRLKILLIIIQFSMLLL